MPLPLIPIIIGAGTAALGIGKGIKAVVDNEDAKNYNRQAITKIDDAKNNLDACRKASNDALEVLGGKKLFVLDKEIQRFVNAFEKLKNVQLGDSPGLDELSEFRMDFNDLKEMGNYAASIAGGIMVGALGGGLAAFGAYGGANILAASGLSGVVAGNATLAFIGGGSLAVGGLGMAGGAAVLGGLVAGPALAIMGFIVGAKASANLDKAKSNWAEAKKIAEELDTAAVLCNGIRRRTMMFERLFIRLEMLFMPLVFEMESIILLCGVNWEKYNDDEKRVIAAAASMAKAIKTVLDTPILTEDGKLTEESLKIATDVKTIVDKGEKA